ncbi:hypothetical protein ABZV77_01345 [Streptomyces sp. NPDC004732]|uniref:hypothetical protein n=1 Tax=Streptomyces sp. NPDC004732 TaxID=3154290 RepID=UPI0033B1CC9B
MSHLHAAHNRSWRRSALGVFAAVACLAVSACSTQGADNGTASRHFKRESNHRLLEQFRSWARDTGESRTARHAQALFTLESTDSGDAYDVEVKTDYSARAADDAKELIRLFRTWWDGDDGDGTARDLVLLDAGGKRLTHSRL